MQQAAHPLVRDRRQEVVLGAVGVEFGHRPVGERQPEILGMAERHLDQRPHLLAGDDRDRPPWVGRHLEPREAALVEGITPAIHRHHVAANAVSHRDDRPASRQLADDPVALVPAGRQRFVLQLRCQHPLFRHPQPAKENTSHLAHLSPRRPRSYHDHDPIHLDRR